MISSVPSLMVAAPMTMPQSATTASPRFAQPGRRDSWNGDIAATASSLSSPSGSWPTLVATRSSGLMRVAVPPPPASVGASGSVSSSYTSRSRKVGVSLLDSRDATYATHATKSTSSTTAPAAVTDLVSANATMMSGAAAKMMM
jgi:hypothetical protein